jgi:outer membrane lipoprotein SlyB
MVCRGHGRFAAAQASTDLGRVAGKVLADDVQAELAQDRGGRLPLRRNSNEARASSPEAT